MEEEKVVAVDAMPEDTEPATDAEPTGEQTGEPPASTDAQVADSPKAEDRKEQYVPITRFNEVNQEMKELREQNIRMQTLIEERLKPPAPPPDPDDEMLDPAVKKIKQENMQLRQALGGLADEQDLLKAKFNIKDYDKIASQVDMFRQEIARRGQYVSRVDAYTYLQGRDAINKPQTVKPKAEIPAIQDTKPEPIPATRTAAANKTVKKPMTLEEEREALGHIKF